MIGYANAAGFGNRQVRGDTDEIARYFSVLPERLIRGFESLESEERPGILLLQNPDRVANVGAAVFFSSVWSKAYEQVGTPYGKVHRDFHYQCLFSAMGLLVECGCDHVRVENPMSGHLWRKDAYVCLQEATQNVRRRLNPAITFHLQEGSYDPRMARDVDANIAVYNLQEHRPIGVCMQVFEGLNMRTVFVERTEVALRNA